MDEYKQLINDIYYKDGTLYFNADGEFVPMKFNDHCGNEKVILNRENVKSMGWEVDTNSESGHTSLPSECFCDEFPVPDFSNSEFQMIMDFFAEERIAADFAALEELVPMEKEKIQHNIDEYTKWAEDIQLLEGREWSPEEMVETFIKRIHIIPEWKPQFHSYNEVREIYREYTKGE